MTERMMFGTVKISALRALLGASRGLSTYEIYNKMSVKAKDRKNLHTLMSRLRSTNHITNAGMGKCNCCGSTVMTYLLTKKGRETVEYWDKWKAAA